jgi:uncharacterized protein (DUF2252 family)
MAASFTIAARNNGFAKADTKAATLASVAAYRATLQDNRRHLLEQFRVVDLARKVVGVGSVGTRAFIVLLQGRDQHDPLFLHPWGGAVSRGVEGPARCGPVAG